MQKTQLIFRITAILGLIGVIAVFASFGSYGGGQIEEPEWETFVSTNGNYNMQVPAGWERSEANYHGTDYELTVKHKGGTELSAATGEVGSILADLSKINNPQKSAVRAGHQNTVRSLSEKLKDFADEGTADYEGFYGAEAYFTAFTYSSTRGLGGTKKKGAIVTTANGTNTIVFGLRGNESDYDKLLPIFDTFVRSFRTGSQIVY